ncbi:Aste57867_17257 [Aphanomyces stellatus]|uniref:Aste57867_17257 protein n=1 Tax=Aphanomyces stellatus TaxID=120398 RepID=A0A485LAY7_9STRA|nr:hypothetical protein As57867_017198 [Aphanomyces stellatus]VFT94013.1 Aste57867_17257 [Aphanomyces stellatus]
MSASAVAAHGVLRRGELLKQAALPSGAWERCWVKMYADHAVDHTQSKLFDVSAIQSVTKVDERAAPHRFVVVTANGTRITFQAANATDCDEWIRCMTDAKRLSLASNGRLLFQQAHNIPPFDGAAPPFVRFSDSASDDDDDDASDTDDEDPSARIASSPARLGVPSPPMRSPVRAKIERESGGSFTIVHGFIEVPDGSRMIVAVPYDSVTLQSMLVSACKQELLHKLKRKIEHDFPDAAARHGLLHDISTEDSGFFVLAMPDAVRDIWLRNEAKRVNFYLEQRLEKGTSSVVNMEVRAIHEMPPPPLQVRILSTVNKRSDLSQREYTAYKIQVEYNDLFWTVDRRYKQFFNLHEELGDYALKAYLPALPPRRAITPKKGSFVAKRQQRLEEYLQDLVALPQMAEDVRVMAFLGGVSTARNVDAETRSVLHVSALHTCLQYGDIVLFKTRFGASKVQRKITGARYDHAAIVVPGSAKGQLALLESTGEGIQVYPLKTRLLAYGREVTNAIVARRVEAPRTPETLAKLQQFVLDVDGNKYSIFGILNRSKVDDKEKTSNYFCSELVAATLQHLGWVQTTVPPSYFWPGSFAADGELEQKHLMPNVQLGPELAIDCKIMEVGRAM